MAYPNTFQDMQNEVINRLRLDSTNELQMVKDAINVVYADAVITNEYLQQKTTVAPSAGGSYTFTSTPIRIKHVQLSVGSVVYQPLRPRALEEILQMRAAATGLNAVTGPPIYFAFDGTQSIEVYPNFQGTESMDIWATYEPTALSANGDVPVMPEPYASRVLVYGALAELADYTKDLLVGVMGYQQLYQAWMAKFRVHVNRRRGAGNKPWSIANDGHYIPHDPSTDLRESR